MSTVMWVTAAYWGLTAVLLVVVGLGAYRFFRIRSSGIPVIMRRMPAEGNHGWRNGLLRYAGKEVKFYQIRSLSPAADAVFDRYEVELNGQRDLKEHEAPFVPFDTPITMFSHNGVEYEAQMSTHGRMAFVSWVEAAPDSRTDKISLSELKRRMRHKNH